MDTCANEVTCYTGRQGNGRKLARGCSSTSWTTSLVNVCAWFVELRNEQAQDGVSEKTR